MFEKENKTIIATIDKPKRYFIGFSKKNGKALFSNDINDAKKFTKKQLSKLSHIQSSIIANDSGSGTMFEETQF